ncbi:unnamed protein product, partial [Symbiodinium necroappetens]
MDVSVDLNDTLVEGEGQRATSLQDKSDGLTAQPHNEELSKLLKKLGYPDVGEGIKPSSLLAKAISACQKRLGKLKEIMPNPPKAPEADATPSTESKESKEAAIQERLFHKLMKMYTTIDEACDELLQFQTDG